MLIFGLVSQDSNTVFGLCDTYRGPYVAAPRWTSRMCSCVFLRSHRETERKTTRAWDHNYPFLDCHSKAPSHMSGQTETFRITVWREHLPAGTATITIELLFHSNPSSPSSPIIRNNNNNGEGRARRNSWRNRWLMFISCKHRRDVRAYRGNRASTVNRGNANGNNNTLIVINNIGMQMMVAWWCEKDVFVTIESNVLMILLFVGWVDLRFFIPVDIY